MSPQLRGIGFTGPRQQRGAIGLMAAVTLGMVLLFMLLVVDSGLFVPGATQIATGGGHGGVGGG